MAATTRGVLTGLGLGVNPHGPMPETMAGQAQACPCCGGFARRAQPVTDRYGWRWSLHTCHACGVQYQARPMTDAARAAFYGSGRYRRLCAAVTGRPWDDPAYLINAQRGYAIAWLPRLNAAQDALPRGAWLDYGGSTGAVSEQLAPWPNCAVTVADYGDGAMTMPEQALAVPDATYDAILCCQTLDHLRAPLDTLRAFLRVSRPGARLFVDVVKLAHTAYKIDHDTYYPTASTFLGLIERSGWVPIWLDGETHPSHWAVLAEHPE